MPNKKYVVINEKNREAVELAIKHFPTVDLKSIVDPSLVNGAAGYLNIENVYFEVLEAHNNVLNRWVELGLFGLASQLVLSGAVAVIGI